MCDLVLYITSAIVSNFRRNTARNVRIRREKETVSTDAKSGGNVVSVMEGKYVVGSGRRRTLTLCRAFTRALWRLLPT